MKCYEKKCASGTLIHVLTKNERDLVAKHTKFKFKLATLDQYREEQAAVEASLPEELKRCKREYEEALEQSKKKRKINE
jgi:hypothetical protein